MTLPSLSVLTPVGPGHEEQARLCMDSVRLAKERSTGPFESIVHLVAYDEKGEKGRGKTRNDLLEQAKTDWIFWLDADDRMFVRAFENIHHLDIAWFDALWGEIHAHGCGESGYRNGQVWPFTKHELLYGDPFYGLQIGYFCRTEVQRDHPWDEEMQAGEDYKMYLALWRDACCGKCPRQFFVNFRGRSSRGPKSASGGEWRRTVRRLLAAAQAEASAACPSSSSA